METKIRYKNCLNCRSDLSEKDVYCSQCGQKVQSPIIRFKDFLKDAFEDYFSIDSKIFKSLFPLLFKPGFLTIEYINGKRNSYVPPFRLFLIISITYFLLLSLLNEKDDFIKVYENEPKEKIDTLSISTGSKKLEISIKLEGIEDSKMAHVMNMLKDSAAQKYISKHGLKAYTDSVLAGESFIYRYISKKFFAMYLTDGKNFGDLMFSSIQKLVFIMAPIMAFVLMLIYFRKKIFYIQHLIFALHFHAFVFLVFIIGEFFIYLLGDLIQLILFLAILTYLLIAIKKVYNESWWRSIFNFILTLIGYFTLAIPTLFALTFVSAILLY
jgi:hypothetical protein